ncbi:UDP-glucoronosyl and UDP-glucosyl transferase domain-containing protein [Ditylenchus destructor]|uniref:glucuronosyltransferase n=1 Tax=Ditylenchus destructor TaxID=166010 RepID=A0AAD4MN40_9BILA|nr:UDP-glucoronosyl and UDP-glucosyl transferase domain-containing protein [Ditylenchus destructor]
MAKLLVNSTLLFLFICILFSVDALEQRAKKKLKILIYSPTIGWSHIQYQGRIADVLVEAGHEVHLLQFQMDPRHANYTGSKNAHKVISVARSEVTRDEIFNLSFLKNPFDGPTNMLFDGTNDDFLKLFASCCQEIIDNRDLISSLEEEKYDVALSEIYNNCIFGVFHKIGVKTKLGNYAVDLTNQLTAMYGIPSPSSYVTNIVAPAINGPRMTFFERAYNFFNNFYEEYYINTVCATHEDPMFKAAFGSDFPSLSDIQRNVSLIFVNTNQFYGLPRPISSKIIYIGGIVESKGKPLTKEVQNIFDRTQSGVVLVSFGTFADSKLISAELRDSMLATFAKFPTYDFIWKFEPSENDTELFGKHPNVHTFAWTDQKTILAHPKTRAFITHCGLNSMNEATMAAVPTVGIPLLADQPLNAAVMNHNRVGVYVDVTKVVPTKGAVVCEALQKVLQEPEYRENARLLQRKLLTQPFSPQEKLVKWVEFAAQFPDLNELNLPTDKDLGYLAYYSLDVLFVSILVMATLLTVVTMKSLQRINFRYNSNSTQIPISTSPTNSYLAMSFLPNEIVYDITNFLPNDDITDQMLMSRNFNVLVTPRLKKIDQEMTTMNQSIESFMPSPAPADNEWIPQLNLKRFEPIGSEAKKRMKKVFENRTDIIDCLFKINNPDMRSTLLPRLKKEMSLERFDDPTFLRILGALIAQPKFRQEYNVWPPLTVVMQVCFTLVEEYANCYLYSITDMSSLPNEIVYDITNFLPNDDITDLMLMSRNFNA